MRVLSRRSGRRLITVVVACVIALVASGVGAGVGARAPVAHAAPLAPCNTYYAYNNLYGFWDAAYVSVGVTSCGGSAPQGRGELYPCSNAYVTVNMDAWTSQSTQPGSKRLAESGRTGPETWFPDCQWHEQVRVYSWG
jgi:hypothetical protein